MATVPLITHSKIIPINVHVIENIALSGVFSQTRISKIPEIPLLRLINILIKRKRPWAIIISLVGLRAVLAVHLVRAEGGMGVSRELVANFITLLAVEIG